MASALAPRLLRRGLELFAAISILGFAGILFYGNNLQLFLSALVGLRWEWVLVGVGLASLDWFGGGLRLWVLARHVHPETSLPGSILAAGLNAWGSLLTPSQTGGGPTMVYAMKRSGTPIPEAMIAGLMSFIATIVFFAVAGPVAVFLGAGVSLEQHGILGDVLTLNDLFRLSLAGFVSVGVVLLFLVSFPGIARRLGRRIVAWLSRHGGERLARRIEHVPEGLDRAHASTVAFFKGRGWISLALAVLLTGAAHANKLMAGYVVLRALDIHAPFLDVVLLQTLLVFLLYFAPTPGGSGIAEILSAAVMSIYVPRELTPSYILLWRVFVSYLTVAFGSYVFWRWMRGAEERAEEKEAT